MQPKFVSATGNEQALHVARKQTVELATLEDEDFEGWIRIKGRPSLQNI